MFTCCGKDVKLPCEQLECKVEETKTGVRLEITAKDASTTESLQAMVKAVRGFCGCC
ncbi:MAG TPA: hypothetical protein VN317_09755 [Candidatus Methanoperedens sp.]|nr:hypothetical protein [Candidatus Methanoperedens sp.]